MTTTEIALLAGGGPAILTAFFGFLVAVRKFSGTIRSSEATTLWDAIEKERANLTARLDAAYVRIDECEARVAELQARVFALQKENAELRAKMREA